MGNIPRPPRPRIPDGTYHVTARGNRRERIFAQDGDQALFLRLVDEVAGRLGWILLGYCLMPNHYHLVVRTPQGDLSAGMHRLNSRYAHWFNGRHGLEGHLFQGRFHAVLLESSWHLLELSRYLALNPVRAGLCRHPGQWEWSSYPALVGRGFGLPSLAVDEVLHLFGSDSARARRAFAAFVRDAQEIAS